MKTTAYVLGIFLALSVGMALIGSVGFTYPRVVVREPLVSPVKINRISGTVIELADGRVLELGQKDRQESWEQMFRESDFLIDTDPARDGVIAIYANQKGWICGTPWARPVRIPLIPQTVYRDRRELVTFAKLKQHRTIASSQPSSANVPEGGSP